MSSYPLIEVHGFKWPRRPTAVAVACLLGRDTFGRWIGIPRGNPWWTADRSRSGVFEQSFVKLVPNDTYWTACFNLTSPIVDVDIVLPVRWRGHILEEVDLELDILHAADGQVSVRDRDVFEQVRAAYAMPPAIATQAETACAQIRRRVEQGAEPFGTVGQAWLVRFIAAAEGT